MTANTYIILYIFFIGIDHFLIITYICRYCMNRLLTVIWNLNNGKIKIPNSIIPDTDFNITDLIYLFKKTLF